MIASDVIARFQRLDGKDVFFLTGTDEHGLKMQQTALAAGPHAASSSPIAIRSVFRDMTKALNMLATTISSAPPRSATTAPRQEIWRRMEAAGDIYLDRYSGWYSVRQEAYFDESETTLGDDGVRREPLGSPVEWVEEESYFFRLSAYQDRLLAHYEANPDFIGPRERRNEVVSFVKAGLNDLSISRTTFDWGVPVPGDPRHVMYVWVDALTNYITAVGFPDENAPLWRFWPADLHVIGKDIVRFHAVYWPAFLMSAGIALPKRVFAHGFLFNRGEKMSKSVGNVIDPFGMAAHYGVDQVRYFFMREVSFGQDGVYSHEAIVNRINADLANDLGNLAQRSLSMIGRYADATVPWPGALSRRRIARCSPPPTRLLDRCRAEMSQQAIHVALSAVWQVGGRRQPLFREPGAMGAAQDAIRSAWGPCSTSPRRSCGRSRSSCSRSCRLQLRGCSTCLRSLPMRGASRASAPRDG